MPHGFLDIAITPSVHAVQEAMGVEHLWDGYRGPRTFDRFGTSERQFITSRDSFYMASVSETGWPYVQHRGGPRGFLKMVDDRTVACADYGGNRQYISFGNLLHNARACLFMMDYPHRARLKIYVHVEVVGLSDDPALTELVTVPTYRGAAERIFRFTLEAFDWNCTQHITPRFAEDEIATILQPMRARISELESENAQMRERLDALGRLEPE